MTFFFVSFDNFLKLLIPKNLLDFLVKNNGAKKIQSTPCFSLIFNSGKL